MKRLLIPICVFASLFAAAPVFASTNDPMTAKSSTKSATKLSVTTATRPAARDQAPGVEASYAERQKAAPEVANFKGGDGAGIYIGGSTLAVVLLVVLIVILL